MAEATPRMDTIQLPGPLPATVTRPRPLIEAVMAQSVREQGPDSRTAQAWQWVLTGQGPSPVSRTPGTGTPPSTDDIAAEARYDSTPPECGWPPWRYAHDRNPDRQQARRVLRWLTGAADAIPLLDPGRGRYVGARFHFARTDEEIRTHPRLGAARPARAWRSPRRHPQVAGRTALAVARRVDERRLAPRHHRLPELGTRRPEHRTTIRRSDRPLDPVTTLAAPDPPYHAGQADQNAGRGVRRRQHRARDDGVPRRTS